MINKLVFFGCSITAGNELYEEAHVPNYNKMSLMEARKASSHLDEKDILAYQNKHSFPFLTASKLGVNFENCAISGISNISGFSGIITGIGTTSGTSGNPLALKFFLNSSGEIGRAHV